jgi:hypothetical protein
VQSFVVEPGFNFFCQAGIDGGGTTLRDPTPKVKG